MYNDNWLSSWFNPAREGDEYDRTHNHTHELMLLQEEMNKKGLGLDGKPINKEDSNEPFKVILEPAKLDLSNIGGGDNVTVRKFEYRPDNWQNFIGQSHAKEFVPLIIESFKMGSHSHIILTGLPGGGKTSYIRLLAKTMKARFIQRIGNTVTIETLPEILKEINASVEPCIFFVDEIDTIKTEILKLMNVIVEEFSISGKKINPFIFACATINSDKMKQKNPDFLSRLKFDIRFVSYEISELITIARQVQQQLYNDVKITDEELNTLALNCRYNPRRIINLLEYLVIDRDINHVLKINEIVRNSLTLTDIKILEYLASNKKAVGSNAIAMKINMRQKEYETEYEPFLFREGYINRVPSRIITEKGKELLGSLN